MAVALKAMAQMVAPNDTAKGLQHLVANPRTDSELETAFAMRMMASTAIPSHAAADRSDITAMAIHMEPHPLSRMADKSRPLC